MQYNTERMVKRNDLEENHRNDDGTGKDGSWGGKRAEEAEQEGDDEGDQDNNDEHGDDEESSCSGDRLPECFTEGDGASNFNNWI